MFPFLETDVTLKSYMQQLKQKPAMNVCKILCKIFEWMCRNASEIKPRILNLLCLTFTTSHRLKRGKEKTKQGKVNDYFSTKLQQENFVLPF